jgi:enoyl-[acyl-carrier protein] reductase I
LDENSIAWKTAERIYEEGGVLFWLMPSFNRMGSIAELAQKTGSTIIPADATSVTDREFSWSGCGNS